MEHRAKKSLGQNFLKSHAALKKMVSAGNVSASDTVLEIGPGKGALTKEILATGAHVIAIEKDDRLIPLLQELFAAEIQNGQLELVHGDALLFTPKDYNLKRGNWMLVANIPYYITGMLVRHFLESENQPKNMTILVQKEVAERVVAKSKGKKGKESILSMSVKAFGSPFNKGTVSKRYFSPMPKVDSAILHITDISHDRIPQGKESDFFILLKQGFGHKRKTLLHNLGEFYKKETIQHALHEAKLSEKVRAEELQLGDWLFLLGNLKEIHS